MRSELLSDYHPEFEFNYCSDGMAVFKNIDFFWDETFQRGYQRGVRAVGRDFGTQWRFQTCLWAAKNGLRLEGDFVECGVSQGLMSSGIMDILDWNTRDRQFYLFDTWAGLAEDLCTPEEVEILTQAYGGVAEHNEAFTNDGFYAADYEAVKENFAEWTNVHLVRGAVPQTLDDIDIERVAYLHIDMNAVVPEIEAIKHFWPRLSTGASVVLDDYAFPDYELQYAAWNEWGKANNVPILTLPTGQGLILKT